MLTALDFLMPPPAFDFVLPGLPTGSMGCLTGPSGTGKSFVALETALSVVSGKDLFGLWTANPEPGRVIVASDDPPAPIHRRLFDMCRHFHHSTERTRLTLLDRRSACGLTLRSWLEGIAAYGRPDTRLIIIDVWNRQLGRLRNSRLNHDPSNVHNEQPAVIELFFESFAWLCRETGAAVMMVCPSPIRLADDFAWQARLTTRRHARHPARVSAIRELRLEIVKSILDDPDDEIAVDLVRLDNGIIAGVLPDGTAAINACRSKEAQN